MVEIQLLKVTYLQVWYVIVSNNPAKDKVKRKNTFLTSNILSPLILSSTY